jgi:hypothetical protein
VLPQKAVLLLVVGAAVDAADAAEAVVLPRPQRLKQEALPAVLPVLLQRVARQLPLKVVVAAEAVVDSAAHPHVMAKPESIALFGICAIHHLQSPVKLRAEVAVAEVVDSGDLVAEAAI